MPDVAADSDEGVLAAWLVEEEARFDAAQTIAYVETQDELFSVEAGRPGMLLKTLVEPGTRVEPGTPIGILGDLGEQVADLDRVLAELVHREPVAAGSVARHAEPPFAAAPAPPAPAVEGALPLVEDAAPLVEEGGVTPLVEEGGVTPLVEEGGVTPLVEEGDVTPLVEEGALAPVSKPAEPEDDAEPALQHHYLRARVRVDRLVALSARLERDRPDSSVTDLVGRAVVAAHRQVPQLGVARLEHDKSAAAGIPVSHPGRFGVEEAAATVPDGQAVALAVGAVRDEPVIDAGDVVPGKVMTVTLSVRPGRIDDVQASRWLAVLVALLERPEWLID